MGLSLIVAFKKKVSPYGKIGNDHMALGSSLDRLDKLSNKHGLPMLSDFHSIDPDESAEVLDMEPEDLGLKPLEWFDPKTGLLAVRGLIDLIISSPKEIKESAAILKDLEGIEGELVVAEKQKSLFHFSLVD